MPKGSPELTQARRDEIINACGKLYETMSFKDITIKEIANFTSFTRPSIYNYFQTKEEIFLALFQREYELWTKDIDSLCPSGAEAARPEFAEQIAHTLERRERLLKLLSMNLNDMEQNSRMEKLVAFKGAYGASVRAVGACLQRFCPEISEEEKEEFIFSFFPLIFGIYPYAAVTDKQREAMEKANVDFRYMSVYELAHLGVKRLLGV